MGLDQYFGIVKGNEILEIAYRRKHPNLHGFLCQEAINAGLVNSHEEFNCVDLEITREIYQRFSEAVVSRQLPQTSGFFFGSDSDEFYYEEDLELLKKIEHHLDNGETVVYNSWW